jgi:hypothetical protein
MVKRMARKRDWQDNSGVSEVVGSILILLMTVTLFSGIILWVWGLPTPDAVSRVTITAEFDPIDYDLDDPPTWDVVHINLTHRGGERLPYDVIEFYLSVNDSIEVLKTEGLSGLGTPYSLTGPDAHWSIGETWEYTNYSMEYYHQIKITLVDRFSSVILWEQNLWGYEGAHPPIFMDKWIDGNPSTETRDLVQDNNTLIYNGSQIPFGIFAKVGDLDNDLNKNSVFVNFTFGPLSGNSYQMADNGSADLCDDASNDFLFSVCDDDFWPAADWVQWDGGTLLLNATDNKGHETVTRLTLRVYNYGDNINLYENDTYETGNASYAKPHEYAIYDEVEWVAYGQGFVITNTETKGDEFYNKSVHIFNYTDTVYVKVLSNILDNAYKANKYDQYKASTGGLLTPPSEEIFEHVGVVASYHKFTLNFTANNISGIDPATGGCFKVFIEIIDTDDDQFVTNTWFEVKKANGDPPACPKMRLFKDSGYSETSKYFNSWDFMHVEVEPAPGLGADNSVQMITVELQDFWGNTQIRSGPIDYTGTCGTAGPVPLTDICIQSGKYRFSIDLLKANRDSWLLGNASYTLYLRILTDANEYYESMSANMFINSPASILDAVTGMAEAKGAGTYADREYGAFYENFGGVWEHRAYAWRSGTSGQTDTIGEIYSVDFADMDGDGDKDILTAMEGGGNSDSYMTLWDNYNGRGSFSRLDIDPNVANQEDFCAVAAGDINADGLWDIVAGTNKGNLYYYKNDGIWDRTDTIDTGIGVPSSDETNGGHGIAIADMDGDKYKEIIVGTDDGIFVYDNDFALMYNEGTANVASVSVGELGYPGGSDNSRLDIAVGYTNGKVAAYLNGGGFSFTRVDVDTSNRGDIAAVGVGDIDGSGWDDIVSGAGGKVLIYKTNSHGEAGFWVHLANDDDSAATTRPNAAGAIGGDIKSIEVANIDGAIEDDIVVVTTNGRVYYYKNIRDAGDWQRFAVDDLVVRLGATAVIYSVATGDMNLGND